MFGEELIELETIFENRTRLTKEVMNEFGKESFSVFGKKYRIFVFIMAVISLLFAITFIIIDGFSWLVFFFILFAGFFLFMFFKAYLFRLKENYKNLTALHGEVPENLIKFYEDRFESITARSNISIEYSKITKLIETENLFILMIEKQGIILLKNGFTTGNFDSFKSFIKEKCNLKLKA